MKRALETQGQEALQHEALVTFGRQAEVFDIGTPTREELVQMVEDRQPRNATELTGVINQWKGKGKLTLCETREMTYEPMSPHYQGSPPPLTDGPDCQMATPSHIESPVLCEVDEDMVAAYMAKMEAQRECLALLEDPATLPKVFEETIAAYHANREQGDNVHIEQLIAGPSGTTHSEDGANVAEEVETSLESVSPPSTMSPIPICIRETATSVTGLPQPEVAAPQPQLILTDAVPFTTEDFIGWINTFLSPT